MVVDLENIADIFLPLEWQKGRAQLSKISKYHDVYKLKNLVRFLISKCGGFQIMACQ